MGKLHRVGLVSTTCWPIIGGMERYIFELARSLQKQERDVRLATRFATTHPGDMRNVLTRSGTSDVITHDGVSISVISPPGFTAKYILPAYRLHFYPSTRSVAEWLFEQAFYKPMAETLGSVQVVHYSGTGRELLGFVALKYARQLGVPFIVTPHIHVGSWGDSQHDFKLYREAESIVALTGFERDFLIKSGISANKIGVIGHGITLKMTGHPERFKREHNINGPLILYIGRKAPYKGIPLLTEAARQIWDAFPHAHFVIIGPPGDATAEPAFQLLLKDERFHNLDAVPEQAKEDALAACDVFCLPSSDEAFGLAYIEAWAYGKPVIGRDIPTLRELVGKSEGGVLIGHSGTELAQAVVSLLQDQSLSKQMGQNGYLRATQHSWSEIATKLLLTYEQALARGSVAQSKGSTS